MQFHFEVVEANPNAPNTFELIAARKTPFSLVVTLSNEEEQWVFHREALSKSHRLPLLGLGVDKTWVVEATFFDEAGKAFDTEPREIQTPSLPVDFPVLTELVGNPTPLGKGFLLFDLKTISDEINYIVVLNADLEVVWWRKDPRSCSALHQQADGTIKGICNHLITVMTMTGETLSRNPVTTPDGEDLSLHHEFHPLPDGGYLSLHSEKVLVEEFPISEDEPDVLEPAEIRGDQLIVVDSELQIIDSWHLSDLLPTSRIGYDSVARNTETRTHDWSHSNGLIRDPVDGGMILSVRHQDTLLKLDSEGEIQWILANPNGWPEAWQDFLLEGVGEFAYPYHQHAPEFDEYGRLWVFDNGNHASTPYSDEVNRISEFSRVVAYEIDEETMQFEQLLSFEQTGLGKLYSTALGDADWLPHLQSVLSVWGRVQGKADSNIPLPTNKGTSAHILIHKPGQEAPTMHLEMTGCLCDEEVYENEHKGWNTYRAQWIQSLYPRGEGPEILPVAASEN
jgi:arylsulfate sulfotransferase